MMKKISIICILIANISFAQKMITKTGEVKFEASVPAFEEIKAINKITSCIFDKTTGNFAALSLIKAFKFKSPLMEEHFNENYMESSKFPKASFKGRVIGFESSKLSNTKKEYDLEGDLTIHGVTKKIKVQITITANGDKVIVASNFVVKPQDYGIEIPSLVKSKIAKNINIALNFTLDKQL